MAISLLASHWMMIWGRVKGICWWWVIPRWVIPRNQIKTAAATTITLHLVFSSWITTLPEPCFPASETTKASWLLGWAQRAPPLLEAIQRGYTRRSKAFKFPIREDKEAELSSMNYLLMTPRSPEPFHQTAIEECCPKYRLCKVWAQVLRAPLAEGLQRIWYPVRNKISNLH